MNLESNIESNLESNLEANNKDIVLKMLALFNQGDVAAYVQFFAETMINHGFRVGRPIIYAIIQDIRDTFPNARMEPLQIFAEGEWVTLRMTLSGTHQGISRVPVNSAVLLGVAPTGKSFCVAHIHLLRISEGLIQEHYACRDDVEMARQLGVLPPLEPANSILDTLPEQQ